MSPAASADPEALAKELAAAKDSAGKLKAIRALRKLERIALPAADALVEALGSKDEAVALAAAKILQEFLVRSLPPALAEKMADRAIDPATPVAVRNELVCALADLRTHPAKYFEPFAKLLEETKGAGNRQTLLTCIAATGEEGIRLVLSRFESSPSICSNALFPFSGRTAPFLHELIQLCRHRKVAVQVCAAESLSGLARASGPPASAAAAVLAEMIGSSETAEEVLRKLLMGYCDRPGAKSPQMRSALVALLKRCGEPGGPTVCETFYFPDVLAHQGREILPDLQRLSDHSSAKVRGAVVKAIAEIERKHKGGSDPGSPLRAALDDPEKSVRMDAAEGMRELMEGFHDDPEVIALVVKHALGATDEVERSDMQETLGWLDPKHPEVIPALRKGLCDKSTRVQWGACIAAEHMGPPAAPVVPELVRIYTDPPPACSGKFRLTQEEIRKYAADAIKEIGGADTSAIAAFSKTALAPPAKGDHSAGSLWRTSVEALARMKSLPEPVVDLFVKMLSSRTKGERQYAAEILGGATGFADKVVPALGKQLEKEKDEFVQCEILLALGGFGPKAAPHRKLIQSFLKVHKAEASEAILAIDPKDKAAQKAAKEAQKESDEDMEELKELMRLADGGLEED